VSPKRPRSSLKQICQYYQANSHFPQSVATPSFGGALHWNVQKNNGSGNNLQAVYFKSKKNANKKYAKSCIPMGMQTAMHIFRHALYLALWGGGSQSV
jgi:hypothetical protein